MQELRNTSGKLQVASGKLQVASWKLQVASGKWQVASGKWQVASGKWANRVMARISGETKFLTIHSASLAKNKVVK